MDGYVLAGIVRAVLDFLLKSGKEGLPIVAGLLAVAILWRGLRLMQDYSKSSADERQRHFDFIQGLIQRQEAREERSIATLNAIDKNQAALTQQLIEEIRKAGERHGAILRKLEKVNEDVWRARK